MEEVLVTALLSYGQYQQKVSGVMPNVEMHANVFVCMRACVCECGLPESSTVSSTEHS